MRRVNMMKRDLIDEIRRLEDKIDENNDRIIQLEVKVDEHESHTLDRRGMYKSFIGISLAIVGSLIGFFQLSLMLNP